MTFKEKVRDNIEEIKEEIEDKISDIRTFFRETGRSIRNIKVFWKVIWQYRWWDYSFFLSVEKKMLEENAKHWHQTLHLHGALTEREIKETKEILDEMIELLVLWESDESSTKEADIMKRFGELQIEYSKRMFIIKEHQHTNEDRTITRFDSPLVLRMWD